jgi:hypothetical protein
MEAAAAKRPRGRPSVAPPELRDLYRTLYPALGERSRAERYYVQAAVLALGVLPDSHGGTAADRERFRPLADFTASRGGRPAIKWTVLAELGRLLAAGRPADEVRALAADVAAALCREPRLPAKAAVRRLRAHRLQRPAPAGDAAGLFDALVTAFERYTAEHPTLSAEARRRAVANATVMLRALI